MSGCIFCKIANKEIPKEFILETDKVMVFPDISPRAPIHLLVVPKKHITEFINIKPFEKEIFDEIVNTLNKLILQFKLSNRGYRIVTNGGGAQAIDHLHFHLMGDIKINREL